MDSENRTDTGSGRSGLPDQPGVYALARIYEALAGNPNVNPEPVYGTKLSAVIPPYKEACYAMQKQDTPENRRRMDEVWTPLINAVITTLYLVPFTYQDDTPGTEDRCLHLTGLTAGRLTKDSIVYRCREMSMAQMDSLAWTCGEGGAPSPDPDWWDISRFSGSDGYRFAAEGGGHGAMNFLTLGDGSHRYFALDTDIIRIRNRFPGGHCPHIAVLSLGDVVHAMKVDPSIEGIILTPDTPTHCFLSRRVFIS